MKVSSNKKERVLAPEGVHNARCFRIVDLGTQVSNYEGRETKSRKVQLGFELVDESHVFVEEKGEENFTLYRDLTMSLNPKATLAKLLTSWTGQKFAKDAEFDMNELLNKPCQIQVVHNVSTAGDVYANINAIMMPPKGAKVSPLTQEKVILSLEPDEFDQEVFAAFPDWLQEKIEKSPEYASLFAEVEVPEVKIKAKTKAKPAPEPAAKPKKKKLPF